MPQLPSEPQADLGEGKTEQEMVGETKDQGEAAGEAGVETAGDMEEEEDEPMCRYCFGGEEDGPLISPCRCKGDQKFVHMSCLRRWQRMVLVSQPTHPAFYQDDLRHQKCNVCLGEFTCPPPTRHELMASFTGPELAALIEPHCIIGSEGQFSTELARQLDDLPPGLREASSLAHWVRGSYLITGVEEDEDTVALSIERQSTLDALRAQLDDNLEFVIRGRRLRVAAGGALEGVAEAQLRPSLMALQAPATLSLASTEPKNCGEDHVAAVNLTRRIGGPRDAAQVAAAMDRVRTRLPHVDDVAIEHYLGGPCEPHRIVSCIVTGGNGRGWTCVGTLHSALQIACSRAQRRHPPDVQGDLCSGQTAQLIGLQARPELNGEMVMMLRFMADIGRWVVRLRNGEGKQVKPVNLAGHDGGSGRVLAFWGDARWTRAQLLGEIARGHWGLTKASVSDLTAAHSQRFNELDGRLAFAPVTEMTENFLRQAQHEMAVIRSTAVPTEHQEQQEEDEEEDPAADDPAEDDMSVATAHGAAEQLP